MQNETKSDSVAKNKTIPAQEVPSLPDRDPQRSTLIQNDSQRIATGGVAYDPLEQRFGLRPVAHCPAGCVCIRRTLCVVAVAVSEARERRPTRIAGQQRGSTECL